MSGWVRLWHDMPTDPKWRVIARRSGRSISEAMSVFTFLMVNASANADERGKTKNISAEDIAAALDMETQDVDVILDAMEGKVIENGALTGWEKRQPKREDNSAERAKKWREERKRTQANAQERPDIEIDSDIDIEPKGSLPPKPKAKRATALPDDWQPEMVGEIREIVSGWTKEEFKDQLANFKDHAKANGRTQKDWPAAFRTWARKHNGWREKNGNRGNTQQRNHSAPPQHNPLVRAVLAEREARAASDGGGQSGGWPEDGDGAW